MLGQNGNPRLGAIKEHSVWSDQQFGFWEGARGLGAKVQSQLLRSLTGTGGT